MIRKTILTMGLAALMTTSAPAALHAQGQAPMSEQAVQALLDRAPAATYAANAQAIPFELFRGTRIFLEGTINGQPARMMLDSGASSTVINMSFARRIGLEQTQAVPIRGVGGFQPGAIASGVTVQAGSFSAADSNVLMLDLDVIAGHIGRPIDVILGMEAFRSGIVDIDFPGRRINFRPAEGFTPPAGAVALPVDMADRRHTIPVSVNGGPPMRADIDLGNGSALMLARSAWEGSAIANLRYAEASAGGVGGMVPTRMTTIPTVSVAGHTFQAVPATLNMRAEALPDSGANIGIDLLQRFRLLFDYGRHTLYMVADPAALAQPIAKNRLGMRLDLRGDRLRVGEVIGGSPAAEAGFRVGDEVVAVNGTPVDARYYFRDDVQFTRLPAGTRVEFARADGTSVPVTLRDYF
ncbi:aspartyl protease family protein [Sphingosinicella sp. YJ22]|uniref:aspartyl protease family protein n=1 Tax=Sphingosinicella sp. YJ22 TaxID=1104780 RepID=UPI00140BB268|nr:aspartyl protease family protein [Sphingosinicella sp. YJ22]